MDDAGALPASGTAVEGSPADIEPYAVRGLPSEESLFAMISGKPEYDHD
jgi:hypothetical protein